jgi:hypothetical protein
MSDNISAAGRLDRNSLIKAMLIFGVAFVAYFLSRSPGLDEYDSVQFAMGVRDFNLWEHQPHPPGLGFGFLQSWAALFAGGLIVTFGFAAYLFGRREPNDRQFWRFHLSWALLHIAIIFVCLPANQRYYLVIYPLLLVACLRGFCDCPRLGTGARWRYRPCFFSSLSR